MLLLPTLYRDAGIWAGLPVIKIAGMKNRYSQKLTVPCYQTDAAQLLKPASFMDLAQEAANLHADVLGFGYDDLSRTKALWVLSRMHVKFLRHPRWREKVNFDTWHKGPSMMFYLRDFRMSDQEGNDLVLATTSWLVIDIDTRKILRGLDIESDGSVCTENAVEVPCGKVQMPRGAEPEHAGVHVVSYSDVDLNGHANNAMYLVWAMDAADYGTVSEKPLREFSINFNHETRPGDVVELYRLRHDDGGDIRFAIEGRAGDKPAFCAELVF